MFHRPGLALSRSGNGLPPLYSCCSRVTSSSKALLAMSFIDKPVAMAASLTRSSRSTVKSKDRRAGRFRGRLRGKAHL